MHCYASHGMCKDGRQVLLINQFDSNSRFYKSAPAELEIRDMAKNNRHTYHFCIFASCREIFMKEKHNYCLSKEAVDAILNFAQQTLMKKFKRAMENNFDQYLKDRVI